MMQARTATSRCEQLTHGPESPCILAQHATEQNNQSANPSATQPTPPEPEAAAQPQTALQAPAQLR